MNPLDDHELLLWTMRAGLTRDEVRQALRSGLDVGDLPRQTAHDTETQRQDRVRVVYDYLKDRRHLTQTLVTMGIESSLSAFVVQMETPPRRAGCERSKWVCIPVVGLASIFWCETP